MIRRVFALVSWLLGVACVLMALLVLVSLARTESFGWEWPDVTVKVGASRGVVVFKVRVLRGYEAYRGEPAGYYHYAESPPVDLEWYGMHSIGSHGFGYFYMAGYATSGHWVERWLLLPGWLVVILFGFLPVTWWRVSRRQWILRRRARENLCNACGYSLTGNTSGVCPECGTAVAGKAKLTT